jgi:magnesium transporter
MLQILKTVDNDLKELQDFENNIWINLINPTEQEIDRVGKLGIDTDYIRAALDEEERSHIESDNGQILIIIDIPLIRKQEDDDNFHTTIPLGIILFDQGVVTVCLAENTIIKDFIKRRIRGFYTNFKSRFVLQILLRASTRYLIYLRRIDNKSSKIEKELHKSLKNSELIELLKLEKSLVYFSTSLKSNEVVLERLRRMGEFKLYEEDVELLEDVIIENKQAIEMATIYSSILSGTMDAFASVISNNLNMVMKFLASITIVLAIPTIVFSFYGMNVPLPLQNNPWAFLVTIGVSIVFCGVSVYLLLKKKMF